MFLISFSGYISRNSVVNWLFMSDKVSREVMV
jgi:hypothetical protein